MALPKPLPGVAAQEVEEGLLLLRDDGHYLLINHTGANLWNKLPESLDEDELASMLASEPGAPKQEVCLHLVKTFIEKLVLEGFLED